MKNEEFRRGMNLLDENQSQDTMIVLIELEQELGVKEDED